MTTQTRPTDQQRVDLAVGGMTCASCAARVEKRLNKLDGAVATVNYATEKARVLIPPSVTVAELVTAVEQAGYTAQPLTPAPADGRRTLLGPELRRSRPVRHDGDRHPRRDAHR